MGMEWAYRLVREPRRSGFAGSDPDFGFQRSLSDGFDEAASSPCSIVDAGHWLLDAGHWSLGSRIRENSGFDCWLLTLDFFDAGYRMSVVFLDP